MVKSVKKLDIACGKNKQEGYTGIDIDGDADIVHDLFITPWPIKSNSVEEVFCAHFVEHIPHYLPQFDGIDGWWIFFDELYRVCKKNAKCLFTHPYAKSERAFWDPTHTRYIHEMTWYYLSKEWRVQQKLDHYPTICDFVLHGTGIQGVGLPVEITSRPADWQSFARVHYWNVIPDLQVELKVNK